MKNTKRALRRQKTANYIKKQTKIARIHHINYSVTGKYRKKAAMDCGRPNCGLCGNPRKSKSFKNQTNYTLQERKHRLDGFD